MKLKIFSDRSYVPQEVKYDFILSPFWGIPSETPLEDQKYPWTKLYVRYEEVGRSFFDLTSLEAADVAIVPVNWIDVRGNTWRTIKRNKVAQDLAIKFSQKVEKARKPVVIFFAGDCSDEEIPIKNAIVFRQSLYHSKKKPSDFAFPAFVEDAVKQYLDDKLPIRQKSDKPVVGFCGYAQKTPFLQAQLKNISYHSLMFALHGKTGVPPYKGHNLRFQALRNLSTSPIVDTNFTKRETLVFLNFSPDMDLKKKLRLEFLQNMVESDYVLCCRGAGNYSYRFIEALCCGRIPVFINTDCVLPYDSFIDWKKYCVWVEESELPQIAQKVAEFHEKLSPQEFVDLQHECRKIWQQWLSPEGFFANFYRHF